jgi:hypothetical protein
MKIAIEIDEQEVADEVKALIIRNAVKKIEEDLYHDPYGNINRRVYKDGITEAVRETVKKHFDDIVNRAVDYAGEYIGKKGLKKMIDDGSI